MQVTTSNISLAVYALKGPVGARGRGEALTSVYLDADKIDCKLGTEFLRMAAQETWAEPAVIPSVDGGGGLPVGRSALALGNPRPATPCSGRRARRRSPRREFSSHAT